MIQKILDIILQVLLIAFVVLGIANFIVEPSFRGAIYTILMTIALTINSHSKHDRVK